MRKAVPKGQGQEADLERAVAVLESEAVRRALSGVSVPVFHQGRECGSTIKHSDQLLMFLLKTLKPGRYACGKDSEPTTQPGQDKILALELDLAAAAHGQDEGEAEETDAGEGGAACEADTLVG